VGVCGDGARERERSVRTRREKVLSPTPGAKCVWSREGPRGGGADVARPQFDESDGSSVILRGRGKAADE
jgi:hypothetical protein